jgi:general secretion pathway protein I
VSPSSREGIRRRRPGRCARALDAHRPASAATSGGRQRGYTLLEVIVAFAVLAVALSVLLGALSGGTRQVRWAADAGRAALLAQSLLDQTGVGEPLQTGRSEGELEDGRYRWSLEIDPYVDGARPPSPVVQPSGPRLLRLQLTMTWGEAGPRERLQLSTLRLVQPDGDGGLF